MAFQAGTNRDGFKAALMKAFLSAHKGGTSAPGNVQADNPRLPRNQNNDTRAAGLMPGGNQAFKMPSSTHGSTVLGGGTAPAPAMTGHGPANHNNDPRRTGFQVAGHQADKIKLTAGSATNSHTLEPKGRGKVKLPAQLNVDARGLRSR